MIGVDGILLPLDRHARGGISVVWILMIGEVRWYIFDLQVDDPISTEGFGFVDQHGNSRFGSVPDV